MREGGGEGPWERTGYRHRLVGCMSLKSRGISGLWLCDERYDRDDAYPSTPLSMNLEPLDDQRNGKESGRPLPPPLGLARLPAGVPYDASPTTAYEIHEGTITGKELRAGSPNSGPKGFLYSWPALGLRCLCLSLGPLPSRDPPHIIAATPPPRGGGRMGILCRRNFTLV